MEISSVADSVVPSTLTAHVYNPENSTVGLFNFRIEINIEWK